MNVIACFCKKFGVLFLCSIWFFPVYIKAQKNHVRYLGIENGLSNNAVTAICQDKQGFIWVGTYDGLNRYDGYGFRIFRNVIGDTNSLKSNNINAIDADSYFNVWAGSEKGVSIYNPIRNSFSSPLYMSPRQLPHDDVVHAVKAFDGDKVLVGFQRIGLYSFSAATRQGAQIPIVEGGKKLFAYNVTCVDYNPASHDVFAFVTGRGLYQLDKKNNSLQLVSNAILQGNCIKVDRQGTIWLGTDKGLYRYDKATHTYSTNFIATGATVANLTIDKENKLWVATDGEGVLLLPPGANKTVSLGSQDGPSLVNSNSIYAICDDFDGRKWIGTLRGGVNVLEPKSSPFTSIEYHHRQENNLVDNFILSFCEDENKVWIGTDGAGVRIWNRADNTYTQFGETGKSQNPLRSNFITSITKDHQGDIWVSTWFGGVSRFKKSTRSFEHYNCYNPKTNTTENNAWFVYEDRQKRLWVSTSNDGTLYFLNRTTNQFELFDDRIVNVQCLAEDGAGALWAGNYNSLIQIDPVNKRHKTYNIGYPVRTVHEDNDKNFWVGTQHGGLLLFDRKTGSFKRFTTNDGLPNNTVLRILEDRNGDLWMSTFNGLTRFNVQRKTFRNFYQTDGLQSNQFSFNAAAKLSNGQFLFGGIKGFNIFYPDSVHEQPSPSGIYLTDLKIDNRSLEDDDRYITATSLNQVTAIRLPYDQAVISIDYLALQYNGTDKIKYAYYLEGWDKGWNYVNDIRTANYSSLREGTYTFKVMISNPETKWGSETKLLKIVVLPPWYRTGWAYTLYLAIAAALAYFYLLYQRRQARMQYEVKLAHLEAEKEKELNEKKTLFFTNISHEFRTPLSLIINPLKDVLRKNEAEGGNHELSVVYKNAKRLLRLVDQLLLFRRAETEMDKLNLVRIDFTELCKEVYSCFVQQAKLKQITYKLDVPESTLLLHGDREKIEIALFNILSNAFKYTPDKGTVTFSVSNLDSMVSIVISDTGIGIPAGTGAKLFDRFYQVKDNAIKASGFGIGLYLVKNFIDAHGGEISYQSRQGEGTTFTIKLNRGEVAQQDSVQEGLNSRSGLLEELDESSVVQEPVQNSKQGTRLEEIVSDQKSVLVIDDDDEIRRYLVRMFSDNYKVFEATDGEDGIKIAHEQLPDIIVSDVVMKGTGGIELCTQLKNDSTVSHIPVILLTGSSAEEYQLKAIESGADDFIKKPFDKDILLAKVSTILKGRNTLQKYFYNEVTLTTNNLKISIEYKQFLDKCIRIVENHLEDDEFSIKVLAAEIGMSHSTLYKKVKSVSGLSVNGFIRFLRLRKAAEILINTENNINQTASAVGFNDIKYFREQFCKLFGMKPSEYIRKFRKPFHNTHHIDV